jgi:folate-binding protein YgfZ
VELSLPDLALDPERTARLRHGAVVARVPRALLRVSGPGAVACLQGLVTIDVDKPGDDSVGWGALLTHKGMIETDLWVLRRGGGFTLVLPEAGAPAARAIFARSLPPRLAKVEDLTADSATLLLLGGNARQVLTASGLTGDQRPGHLASTLTPQGEILIARPPHDLPFGALLVGAGTAIEEAERRLLATGATAGGAAEAEAARILAGWPALGAEIDDRTLPQEVRFDELGGVSYTKGCYLGQETVARLHFRGHPNRELRGLLWADADPLADRAIVGADREAGTVRSTLTLDGRRIGLAPIRREVATGAEVMAGGRPATVVPLPVAADLLGG